MKSEWYCGYLYNKNVSLVNGGKNVTNKIKKNTWILKEIEFIRMEFILNNENIYYNTVW